MLTVKEYADKENVSIQSVYQKIKRGSIKHIVKDGTKYIVENSINTAFSETKQNIDTLNLEKTNIKLETENKFLNNQLKAYEKQIEKLEKENEDLKYQIKQKDFEIKSLLEKMENLNDRVIGLIEWKNTSWLDKIFKRKK